MRRPFYAPLAPLRDPDALAALGSGHGLVLDDMLGSEVATAVRTTALRLDADGALRPAGIGPEATGMPGIRGDRILWLDPDIAPRAFLPVLDLFVAVMQTLEELAWLGTDTMECQLAIYDTGSFYARHRDAMRGSSSRRATAIYYANDWQPGDGGELELVDPDPTPESPDDDGDVRVVPPIADRLVILRAETTAHAVRPVVRGPRVALSAFFRNAAADAVPWHR